MKKIKKILLIITSSLTILIPYRRSEAMPQPLEYNYRDVDIVINEVKHELLNNRAIILRGSRQQQITIGNEKVARKYRIPSGGQLHLHHLLFKGIRNTFPAIPFLCMQTPRDHHMLYHNDRSITDTDFSRFTNMVNYLRNLGSSITSISQGNPSIYSNLCTRAARLVVDCQLYWIGERYSWLHSTENGKYLLLAQRLIAKNCFPNQILANKNICESQQNYISNQLALSNFVLEKISLGEPVEHLADLLQARIYGLRTYVTNFNPLTRSQALNMANNLYGDSEKFHNPISHHRDLAGEFDRESSVASSLADE